MKPLEPKAKRCLKELMTSDDDATRLKACELIYAYRYGRPVRRAELSGPDGGALELEANVTASAQRVVEAFSSAAEAEDPGQVMGDEALRSVQAISFVAARASAHHGEAGVTALPGNSPANGLAPRPAVNGESHEDTEDASQAAPEADPETLEPGEDCHLGGLVLRCLEGSRPGLPPSLQVLVAHNEKMIRTMPNCLRDALAWVRRKYPECADEVAIVRPTPSRHNVAHGRPDQLSGLMASHPSVHRTRIGRLRHPEPLARPIWAVAVLLVGIVLEGFSLRTAVREADKARGDQGWWHFIRRSKSPELPIFSD